MRLQSFGWRPGRCWRRRAAPLCDLLAAHPFDPDRRRSVMFDRTTASARSAPREAVAADPNNLRLAHSSAGRWRVERTDVAVPQPRRAAHAGGRAMAAGRLPSSSRRRQEQRCGEGVT
jgi:hypothetical protein